MPFFNKEYFDNILKESDVRFQQIVEYAALKLVEKDEIIDKLKSDMDEMRRVANDNKKKIGELKEQIQEAFLLRKKVYPCPVLLSLIQ